MGTSVTPAGEDSQGSRVLEMIRVKYPGYHPLMAIADVAHSDDADPKTKLDCHKVIAKYVQPELKSIDVKGQITETRRVIVSMFDEGEGSQEHRSADRAPSRSSAQSPQTIEGTAMILLDSPAVTVADDPMWRDMIMAEALAA